MSHRIILCQVTGFGSETGGAFATVSCYQNGIAAPIGSKFVVVFSSHADDFLLSASRVDRSSTGPRGGSD